MAKKDYTKWSTEDLIDEIKQLHKRKKYGLVWEEKQEDVVEQCKMKFPVLVEVRDKEISSDPGKQVNLLIEGDNYHALSVLNYTHKRKIDVIYIDPPYNTGARNWKYNNDYVDRNDAYSHSKWLSMMNNRLRIAKRLLKKDGVLICAIDKNELNRLGLLLEDVFVKHELHCVTIVHNPRGVQGKNFSYTHEYAYFVLPAGIKVIGHRKLNEAEITCRNLRDNGGESLRTDARNCFYPIILKDGKITEFGGVVPKDEHPEKQTIKKEGKIYIYPIDSQRIERKWRYARQSVEGIKESLLAKKTKNGYEIVIRKDYGTVRTVWQDKRYDANEHGTKLIHALVPETHFDFPKSIHTVYDCIAPILHKKKNAIILDFFAGSGTTGHAVLKLNKEDRGSRKFILCTNNELNSEEQRLRDKGLSDEEIQSHGICQSVTYPRIKNVINGYLDVQSVPANLKYYKTSFVPAKPTDRNKIILTEKATEMLCVKEDTFDKVKANQQYKIFRNKKQYTGIIFSYQAIDDFKNDICNIDKKCSVYVFSLCDDTFEDEFEELKGKVKLSPIPEAILRVYRRIFK